MTRKDRRIILLIFASLALASYWASMGGIWGQIGWPGVLSLAAMMSLLVIAVDDHARRARICRCRSRSHRKSTEALRTCLKRRLGDTAYESWFNAMDLVAFDGRMVTLSVATRSTRNYILDHHFADLQDCCQGAFAGCRYARLIARSDAT